MAEIKHKTWTWWFETFGSFILASLITCFIYNINPSFESWKEFIKEFPTLGMCAFGFLLTFLGIILGGGSETINWLKSRPVLYRQLIGFNKRIVLLALFLSLYSYGIAYFKYEYLQSFGLSMDEITVLLCYLLYFFIFGFFWFLLDTVLFIIIFYLIIESD